MPAQEAAAAAIGGNGGEGGAGGSYTAPTFTNNQKIDGLPVSIAPVDIESPVTKTDDGKVGLPGEVTGTIRVVGFLNLKGSGGLAAAGGKGGNGGRSMWTDRLMEKDAYEAYETGTGNEQLAVISGPGGGGWPNGSGGGSGSGSGSGGSTRPTAPQTGDTFQPLVWCGALALSAAGMAVCRQLRRKDA